LSALAGRDSPVAFLGFGAVAAETLQLAGIQEEADGRCVLREHPARADQVLALENPFLLANRYLESMGVKPIAW
jgi:uracil-DNA glycosylase